AWDNPWPGLRSALFDHSADFADEKWISPGTLPDRLLKPRGNIGLLKRRAHQFGCVGLIERFEPQVIDVGDALQTPYRVSSRREHDHDLFAGLYEIGEECRRRRIKPVHILDNQDAGTWSEPIKD